MMIVNLENQIFNLIKKQYKNIILKITNVLSLKIQKLY